MRYCSDRCPAAIGFRVYGCFITVGELDYLPPVTFHRYQNKRRRAATATNVAIEHCRRRASLEISLISLVHISLYYIMRQACRRRTSAMFFAPPLVAASIAAALMPASDAPACAVGTLFITLDAAARMPPLTTLLPPAAVQNGRLAPVMAYAYNECRGRRRAISDIDAAQVI